MTDETASFEGESSKRVRRRVVGNYAPSVNTPFAKALARFVTPGARHADLEAFFGNRAGWQAIREWRLGRTKPPAWAIAILQRHVDELGHELKKIQPSAGQAVGWKNIQAWRAKQST